MIRALCLVSLAVTLAAPAQAGGLRILLTNDDGYQQTGIRTLRDALREAGHAVTMVAPLGERSGSGASIIAGEIPVKRLGEHDWAVDAPPAACVFIGLTAILEELPDLIVSGANDGNNVGPASPFSGTVGGAVAALHATIIGAAGPIPAMVVSADAPVRPEEDPAVFERHYEEVAAFAVRLIAHLRERQPTVVPAGMALSLNYPPLRPEEIRGVRTGVLGKTMPDFALDYDLKDDESAVTTNIIEREVDPDTLDEAPDADVLAFHSGYITIVALDGDYTASAAARERVEGLLQGFDARELTPTSQPVPETGSPTAQREATP